jgi:hypothetical protein
MLVERHGVELGAIRSPQAGKHDFLYLMSLEMSIRMTKRQTLHIKLITRHGNPTKKNGQN